MDGHAQQSIDRYLELSGKTVDSLRKVATSCIDDPLFVPADFTQKGALTSVAACVERGRQTRATKIAEKTNFDVIAWTRC